jgi:hypothetical protein
LIVRTDKELVAGKYTRQSWAGKTPSPHDLYLGEVWLLNKESGQIVERLEPHYGAWFSASSIKDIYVAEPPTEPPT